MATLTFQALCDLDGSGAYATDITEYLWRDDGLEIQGLGRAHELDAADKQTVDISLDNRDGRFSSKNGSSPYASGGVNLFRPYILFKLIATFDAVNYTLFNGIVTGIAVRPDSEEQLVYVTATDFWFLLRRTEVRRPLMRDQRTGVILHRLLDDVEGAEDREEVANPRFEHNATGWQGVGGGSIDRITTGFDRALILEGPAAGAAVATGAASGARYNMSGLAGLKFQITAYVKPETDADIGKGVRVRVADNLGFRADSGYQAMSNRDIWTRPTVSGTFDAGSTSQFLYVEADAACSFRIGAGHAVPFVNAIARDIDDGQATLAYWTEYRGKAHEAIERVRRDEQFALFFFDGSGTAVFHDKTHRWTQSHSLTVQSTFDERGVLDYSELADDRIKTVRVDYPVHVEGTGGQVVAAIDNTIPLAVGFRRAVFLDYDDGLAKDIQPVTANTDYTIKATADGTGADVSGSVTFEFEDLGSAAVGYFTNNTTRTAYLRTFQVRGTAVRLGAHRETATAVAAGGPALAAEHGWALENNASEPYAQSAAEYVANRYSTQRERLTATHSRGFPEAIAAAHVTEVAAILARGIGDRVRYTQDNLPFSAKLTDADYYVDSIDLSIPGDSIQATWRLSPVDDDYWVIEEAGSALGVNTVLAA